jgi:hypothetical protein
MKRQYTIEVRFETDDHTNDLLKDEMLEAARGFLGNGRSIAVFSDDFFYWNDGNQDITSDLLKGDKV